MVDTAGFKGYVRESARVYFNDPDRSSTLLSLEVEVKPIFNISPRPRFLLNTTVGRPAGEKLRLEVALDQPVRITGLDHPFGDDLTIDLQETDPGKVYQLSFSTGARRPVRKADRVVLKLEGGPVKTFSLGGFLLVQPAEQE